MSCFYVPIGVEVIFFMESEFEKEYNEGVGMTCEEVRDLLYLYICDELDDAEVKLISAHLSTCPECRQATSETVMIAGALSQAMPRIPQNYYSRNN